MALPSTSVGRHGFTTGPNDIAMVRQANSMANLGIAMDYLGNAIVASPWINVVLQIFYHGNTLSRSKPPWSWHGLLHSNVLSQYHGHAMVFFMHAIK